MYYFQLIVSDEPEDKYLNRFVRDDVCSTPNKWWDLGVELLSSDQTKKLNVIEGENDNPTICFKEMIKVWRETQLDASWGSLIKALVHVNLNILADRIKSLLQTSEELDNQQLVRHMVYI